MATMNVSLPDPMKAWVEAQVKGGQYGNASDYVRDLIRRDQQYKERQDLLRREIEKGLSSGISYRSREQIIAEAKAELEQDGV